jgi:hypothetical protein
MATYSSFKKINAEAIIDGAVTAGALATNSVGTTAFASASVRTTDILDGAVGTTQLASTIDLSGKTMTYRAITNTDIGNTSIGGGQLAGGAIVSNIGYSPVNKAGDSVSSPIRLPTASVGTPAIASSGNTNTGIYFPAASQVGISTAGGNANLLEKSGSNVMHTQPNMPAFHASGNGGWYYGNSFGGVNRWTEINNLQPGSGFAYQIIQKGGTNCAASGRFTAPVAGWYSFHSQTYAYNDTNNSGGYTHWVVGLNGSNATCRTTGRAPHTLYGHQVSANHIPGIMATHEIFMNAGDYTAPYAYFSANFRIHGDHALWCGYLIG